MTRIGSLRNVVAALAAGAVLAGSARPAAACPKPVDERNLPSTANVAVHEDQTAGQTFTVGVSGHLLAIEVAPLLDTTDPGATIFMDIFDGAETLLGTVSRLADGFEPHGDVQPEPIPEDAISYGWFDLESLDIHATAGDQLSFVVRHGDVGVCDGMSGLCSAGRIGALCGTNVDCRPTIRLGTGPDRYEGGVARINGIDEPDADLAFKTIMETICTECPQSPAVVCRGAGRSTISLRSDLDNHARDALGWKWNDGDATPKSAFGNPVLSTDYSLCAFDAGGLVLDAVVAPGSRWSEKTAGYNYKDSASSDGGVSIIKLKEGAADGETRILVKGKGENLAMAAVGSLAAPLVIQLVSGDGECWGATYQFEPLAEGATKLKATAD